MNYITYRSGRTTNREVVLSRAFLLVLVLSLAGLAVL